MRKNLMLAAALTLALPLYGQTQEQVRGATVAMALEPAAATTQWDALVRGNRDFMQGRIDFSQLTPDRVRLQASQDPRVTVLSCSDSRVPPELVFNQGLGDLFVVRTAGNVADEFGIGSIEYAVASGFTDLIVVLGHEACGAVKASLDHGDPGTPALRALVSRIRLSFTGLDWHRKDVDHTRRAVEMNARSAANGLISESEVIRDAAAKGTLRVVPAYYNFSTGAVERLD